MQGQAELIDLVKEKSGIPSDYALASKLGITRQLVSGIRNGRNGIPEPIALKMAQFAKINPALMLAMCQQAKAKTPEARTVWRDLCRALPVAASFAGGLWIIARELLLNQALINLANAGQFILCEIDQRLNINRLRFV